MCFYATIKIQIESNKTFKMEIFKKLVTCIQLSKVYFDFEVESFVLGPFTITQVNL